MLWQNSRGRAGRGGRSQRSTRRPEILQISCSMSDSRNKIFVCPTDAVVNTSRHDVCRRKEWIRTSNGSPISLVRNQSPRSALLECTTSFGADRFFPLRCRNLAVAVNCLPPAHNEICHCHNDYCCARGSKTTASGANESRPF